MPLVVTALAEESVNDTDQLEGSACPATHAFPWTTGVVLPVTRSLRENCCPAVAVSGKSTDASVAVPAPLFHREISITVLPVGSMRKVVR